MASQAGGAVGGRADYPLDLLRTEHRMLREMFGRYFHARDPEARRDLGSHLLLLLELHASVEEGVFYPRVRQAAPFLIGHCEHEHEQVRRIVDMLKPMDEVDRQAEILFRQLADAVLSHIETEEQQLFPQIEEADLDLGAVGTEMRALETRLAALHKHPPPVRLRQ